MIPYLRVTFTDGYHLFVYFTNKYPPIMPYLRGTNCWVLTVFGIFETNIMSEKSSIMSEHLIPGVPRVNSKFITYLLFFKEILYNDAFQCNL